MRFLTLFVLLFLLPSAAMAGVFTISPTDKSVEILGYIFGPHVGSVYLGGPANPALLRMFELFNSVIISLGTIIVAYIGVVSTINTAQEGKTMGKKWNSIWIPLRATLGMTLLIPTPASGYSLVQTSVMWLILQGVGAADQIWNGVLADLSSGLGVIHGVRLVSNDKIENPVVEPLTDDAKILSAQLLRSAVCMAGLNQIATGTAGTKFGFSAPINSYVAQNGRGVKWYSIQSGVNFADENSATISGTAYIGDQNNERFHEICGKYAIEASVKRSEWPIEGNDYITAHDLQLKAIAIYLEKERALHLMFNGLADLAVELVNESPTVRPRSTIDNRLIFDPKKYLVMPEGYKERAIETYISTISALVKPQPITDELTTLIRTGRLTGWIAAGSFYFSLVDTRAPEFFDSAITQPPIAYDVPSCDIPGVCTGDYKDSAGVLNQKLRDIVEYQGEKNYLATRLYDASIYLKYTGPGKIGSIGRLPDSVPQNDLRRLQENVAINLAKLMTESNVDPMIAQGKFGAQLMVDSEKVLLQEVNGQKVTLNMLREQYKIIPEELLTKLRSDQSLGALGISIYTIVWVLGSTLAIYVPLIPYMMFTVAVIGWFLLVIEAIVAAPILALSFILPSGEELGKIMQGLMLLLNIMLRPTLMLFGLILGARLYKAMISLVNFGMIGNFSKIETTESLLSWIAVLTVYAAFVIVLSNKCFSLIYAIPDKVLRWMGGGPEHTDVSQEMHQTKSMAGKGAETTNKLATGAIEREMLRNQDRIKQGAHPPDPVRGDTNDQNKT